MLCLVARITVVGAPLLAMNEEDSVASLPQNPCNLELSVFSHKDLQPPISYSSTVLPTEPHYSEKHSRSSDRFISQVPLQLSVLELGFHV